MLAACIAVLGCALLVSGCKTRGGPVPYDVAGFDAPDQFHASVPAEQRIAPLDKLTVTVFRVPDLSGTYEVSVGGRVNMPLIGEVAAINLTPAELASQLEQRYDTQYLRNPDITVAVAESQTSRLTIDGGVVKPGIYTIRGGTDLMTAVAIGGGLATEGNPKRVAVFRKIDGVTKGAAFDLSQIRAGEADNPPVYPGDIIYVDSAGAPAWFRDVLQGISTLAIFTRL